jgi:hypothetical protein
MKPIGNRNELRDVAALVIILMIIFGSIAFIIFGCGPTQTVIDKGDEIYQDYMEGKGCEPTNLGCARDQLMICDADHEWAPLTQCNDYVPRGSRQCCVLEGKAGCYRVEDCEGASHAR